jgi:hypothetical protein
MTQDELIARLLLAGWEESPFITGQWYAPNRTANIPHRWACLEGSRVLLDRRDSSPYFVTNDQAWDLISRAKEDA